MRLNHVFNGISQALFARDALQYSAFQARGVVLDSVGVSDFFLIYLVIHTEFDSSQSVP